MAGFQFIHIETYGRASPKKAARARWTIRDVIAEARREAGACSHVAEPRPPVLLHGQPLADVERELLAAAEAARDAAGRRLRRDAQLLLAGVASFPVRLTSASESERRAFDAWEVDTVAWLRTTYGEQRLRAVIRHEDESFGHLHWFAVPALADGERMDALHPGRRAIAEAKAAGIAQKSELDRRYCTAMREFQDEYHAAVGLRHGLTRSGPGRRRLTRAEWQAERAAAERTSGKLDEAEQAIGRAAEVETARVNLAYQLADESQRRQQTERERNDWSEAAKCLAAELKAERTARLAAQDAMMAAQQRADVLERMLAETRAKLQMVVMQASAVIASLLDPFRNFLPPQCPEWLAAHAWTALRARVSGDRRVAPRPPSSRERRRADREKIPER